MNILINTMILVLPTISEYSIVEEVKRKNTCKFMSTPTAISKLFIVFNFDAGSKHYKKAPISNHDHVFSQKLTES